MAEEFTSNWWEHLFNHTAKKIETTQDNVLAETEPVKKDEAKPNDDQRKSYFYSRFQKVIFYLLCLILTSDQMFYHEKG